MNDFRYAKPIEVRFRDCDPMGHVNNAVYMTYLEVARFSYWRDVVGLPAPGAPGFILARSEVDYRGQAEPGDLLDVHVRAVRIGTSSFTVASRIVRPADGALILEATNVLVMYDYAAKTPVPVPAAVRATLSAYEGRDLSGGG
ncbi:MAG: acyl-CoA thioesterase [Vicinamibacterales bacterium]